MPISSTVEQVVSFYHALFEQLFSAPFRHQISNPLERNAVVRLIGELADAASQSLTLFLDNRRLKKAEVAEILGSFTALGRLLELSDISQPGVPPETLVKKKLARLPYPESVRKAGHDAVYRLALQSVLENLLLIGPVMSKWQKFKFSRTYEPPRRIVERLNRNIVSLGADEHAGHGTTDERYALDHRNYLLQRFERIEAGTVQMTTNMVDLQALFVMPRVQPRPLRNRQEGGQEADEALEIMNLEAARKFFGRVAEAEGDAAPEGKKGDSLAALEQVRLHQRMSIIGVPGSGKSTLLEWLQLSVAGVREVLVAGDEQAIPLLLRVRELEARKLPRGAGLIRAATGSEDRADLMPEGWLERQMKEGRVLFMLDGLDEAEPRVRDKYIIPWLAELCEEYPDCRYLVSSRPAGYPPGTLRKLKFVECDLLEFGEEEIKTYTQHWCTAIRLARSEPEEEAHRQGAAEGESIVDGFKNHPYIKNLARNPLMLSAVCLVNYFEDGRLPEDRARLYKLCVEGLLHHWDSRRGIRSDFSLDEKLRTCRQLAIAMQADDRAEYEAVKVLKIFTRVLDNGTRAQELLEHIRYRTGLLIERRAGIFAFAHLTFQEYLAACAVHEGNYRNIDARQLAREHADGRWNEVIALYCGLSSMRDSRRMIEYLIEENDTTVIGLVLGEAYLSSVAEVRQDRKLRKRVIKRIAIAPSTFMRGRLLNRFPREEVAPIANLSVGRLENTKQESNASSWFHLNPEFLNESALDNRLRRGKGISHDQASELVHLLHEFGSTEWLAEAATDAKLYRASDSGMANVRYGSLAEAALIGLGNRQIKPPPHIVNAVFLQILRGLAASKYTNTELVTIYSLNNFMEGHLGAPAPEDVEVRRELASLARQVSRRLGRETSDAFTREPARLLDSWADSLEDGLADDTPRKRTPKTSKRPPRRTAKKTNRRR